MSNPTRALVVVDVQQEYFSGPLEIQYPAPLDSLARIAAAHKTLMALLNSNFAAVAPTDAWISALPEGRALAKDTLPSSATSGAERFPR